MWVAISILLLAFAFQGARGIWEPDEGFYTNVAVGMVNSGDWLIPRLNGRPFLDKPPLVYWSMAAAMKIGGVNEWSARAPHALWFAGTALLLGALAARWWGRRAGWITALVYALSLAPFVAANVVTPDTPLAFAVALAYLFYARLEEESATRSRWIWGALLGLAVGLGALAKGPAMLMFVAPMVVHRFIDRRSWRGPFESATLIAAVVALIVLLPWYFAVVSSLPGAGQYILDNQIVGRLVTAEYARNSGPWDGFKVYLPTLILGSLPWSAIWLWGWIRSRVGRESVDAVPRLRSTRRLLLRLWFWLPLGVLLVARSRLPLYALPLFGPLALITAYHLDRVLTRSRNSKLRTWFVVGAVWAIVLVGIKVAAVYYPNPDDSRRVAHRLRQLDVRPGQLVVTVDTHRNGLAFYGYERLKEVTMSAHPYPFYALPESLASEVRRISAGDEAPVLVVKSRSVENVVAMLEDAGIPIRQRPLIDELVLLNVGSPPVR